jgi:hypothetical protein
MRAVQQAGTYKDTVDALSPLDPKSTVKLGITTETFRMYQQRRFTTAIAQYYGIVQDGLSLAQHAFRGLRRPLMHNGDVDADRSVLVYTWRSLVDYVWDGSPQAGAPKLMVPPPGRVFAVLVREQENKDGGVYGSIERWNWVEEDPELPHAPVAWAQRYGKKLWSINA